MLCVALLVASLARPDGVDTRRLVGQSDQTAKRLAEAERTLAAGKPADALDQLLAVQTDAGDDLVPAGGNTLRPARRVAQRLLVKLPPPVLRTFRDRVDGPADTLLAAGTRDRDPRLLRTLLSRYFPATASGPALRLLGELHFERGEFREAETCWRRLLPSAADAADPSVPEPPADPARVRALVALAVVFQGEPSRAAAEVAALRAEHPTAAGRLAGVDGVYADTLAKLLDTPPRPPAASGDGDWPTFAGSFARDGRATGKLPRYWPTRPNWFARFPEAGDRPALATTPTARSVALHPVVLDGVGYVADPWRVFAFDPMTGAGRVAFDVTRDPLLRPLRVVADEPPRTADADFPLTAADGRLFARLGRYPPAAAADKEGEPTSLLVCLAPRRDAGRPGLDLRWVLPPPARDGAAVAWEAAPVWLAGRVYAAFTRLDGTTRTFGVAAYTDPPGERPLWTAELASAPAADPRTRQEPLTAAGGKLFYCTHAGSVLALDPATGKPVWAVRYPDPIRKLAVPGPPRDLQPPLAAGGRVFVAPLDSDVILALDADTGRQLWAADGLLTDQLLGVTRGRLVVTLAGPQKGVRGLDAATGSDRGPAGWRVHDDPQLGSFGRGLVADDVVMWPTGQGLFLLDPETGRPVSQPLPGPGGNLAFAAGVLLTGTPFGVAGYVPDRLVPNGGPRTRALALAEAGRVPEAVSLARSAGLPDAERLAAWWDPTGGPPTPRPPLLPPEPTAPGVTRFSSLVLPLKPLVDGVGLPGLADSDPLLFVTDGPRVLAYRPGGTAPAWAADLPPGLLVSRAVTSGQDVYAVGPHGAVRLDRADGRLLWAFAPPAGPGRGPRPHRPPLPAVLADFCLCGGQLCCRLGRHTLLGLCPDSGRVAWARDGLLPRWEPFPVPTAPGYTHLSSPDGRRLVARRTDGRVFVLEPAGGDVVGSVPAARVPWDGPPALAGDGVAAVAEGPDRVTAVDLRTARPVWSGGLAGESAGLTGRPPQLLPAGGGLLVAGTRTDGAELGYVRRRDGDRPAEWDEPVPLPAATVDLSRTASDARTAFVVAGGQLVAVRLADAGVAWQVPLPGPGGWRAHAGSGLTLVPDAAAPAEPVADVLGRLLRRFAVRPHAGRLPVVLVGAYDGWAGRTAGVVRLDPATGQELGRTSVPAVGPWVGVHLGPGPNVIVTATAAHWLP